MLDLQLLSPLRRPKRRQARDPADPKLLKELSAPASTRTGTRQTRFPQVAHTPSRQPLCPHSNKALLQKREGKFRSQTSHREWDAAMGCRYTQDKILQDSAFGVKPEPFFPPGQIVHCLQSQSNEKGLDLRKKKQPFSGTCLLSACPSQPWLLSCLHKQGMIYFPHHMEKGTGSDECTGNTLPCHLQQFCGVLLDHITKVDGFVHYFICLSPLGSLGKQHGVEDKML